MNQQAINFNVKKYIGRHDYIEDGCPVRYFEFNKSEYYGLIAVRKHYDQKQQLVAVQEEPAYKLAIQTYIETVCGTDEESGEEVLAGIEPYPKEISQAEALLKWLLAPDNKGSVITDAITQFNTIENGLVLIDSNLI